jgi:hypothetical protein
MNLQEETNIVLIFDYLSLEEKSTITSWTFNDHWVAFGTLAGSVILYTKNNQNRAFIMSFLELMEAITTLAASIADENLILIGTKCGLFGQVNFVLKSDGVASQEWIPLRKFEDEIIDIQHHLHNSILVVTLKTIHLLKYEKQKNSVLMLQEDKLIYTTENAIVQINLTETKLIVTTTKSYFIVNLFGDECIQVGSKEKQGIFGGTFYSDDTRILLT